MPEPLRARVAVGDVTGLSFTADRSSSCAGAGATHALSCTPQARRAAWAILRCMGDLALHGRRRAGLSLPSFASSSSKVASGAFDRCVPNADIWDHTTTSSSATYAVGCTPSYLRIERLQARGRDISLPEDLVQNGRLISPPSPTPQHRCDGGDDRLDTSRALLLHYQNLVISPAGKFNTYTTNTPRTYFVPLFNNAYAVY
ncbi:hypothetical protein DFH08DRAFT_799784 [Mycena albidolilacea]|uniref:Uncharacterized protein n=1 Tax=Mycena albidolilacea TaxID=1033008 RepID=A0AAD7AM72_9AGAR|nr:hypothetical protein DFH08DRAFT_799784 [Mycena albidolilacea]